MKVNRLFIKNSFTASCRLSAALLLFSGCAYFTPRKPVAFVSPEFADKKPRQIAVLIFDNTSLDLQAAEMLRPLVREHLEKHGYPGPALAAVDSKLNDIGVSDGGQLRALKAQDLGREIGVDGLLYGVIEEFTFDATGFGVRRAVRLKLTLLRADDGDKLWEYEAVESNLHPNESGAAADRSFSESSLDRSKVPLAKRPLYAESQAVIAKLLATLPRR